MDPPHTGPPDGADATLPVPGGRRQRAEEWALVLASQGIASAVQAHGRGYVLCVAPNDLPRATSAIDVYLAENPAVPETEAEPPPMASGEPGIIGLVFGFTLLAVFAAIGGRDAGHPFFAVGSADAGRILAGEWWRAATALCLHADLGHVLGNALFGVYFVTAVAADRGSGLTLALIVASGTVGNLANALHHTDHHVSVGASTAVFGAIGALAGLALARRNRSGFSMRGLLAPIGAALGLLAMLGTSGARVDIWAHLYGLLAGMGLAVLSAWALPTPPRWPVQWVLGVGAVAFVLESVVRALG